MLYAGNRVQLKSGGPEMIVLDYHPPTGTTFVVWQAYGEQVFLAEFPIWSLNKV
jgi:uncharacterized protein YodC (DUF2158 family)